MNYPKTTLMRRNLYIDNPSMVKSGTDGKIYKRTGRVIDADYVIPKGRVYTVPPTGQNVKGAGMLEPFSKVMDKRLREKGLVPPSDIDSKAKLFYNQVVAAKGFNGAKPINFEALDHADAPEPVVDNLTTYFKSLVSGVQPNGQPLSPQDAKIASDVKQVVQQLQAKINGAGLSPQDTVALGGSLPAADGDEPFYKKKWFKYVAIGIIAVIVLKMIF